MSSYHRSSGSGKFIFGMLLGFIGGILLAPKSGKETLEQLKAKAEELKVQTTDLYDANSGKIVSQAQERTEQIKMKIDEARSRLNDQMAVATEKVKGAAENIGEKAATGYSSTKSTVTQVAGDLKERAQQVTEDVRAKATQITDDIRERSMQASEDIKQKAEDVKNSVSDADIKKAAQHIESLKKDLENREN